MQKTIRVALTGNPNCGKTSIFNQLTGTRQHIGNYPGVTVESKTGTLQCGEYQLKIVDLPGIYSLSSSSPEEKVAFQELLSPDLDLIINVIDSSVPQRSLYLTTQLAELGIPMILVFNMSDEAAKKGLQFDLPKLEQHFGARIVRSIGTHASGVKDLLELLKEGIPPWNSPRLSYGEAVDDAIEELQNLVQDAIPKNLSHIPARFFVLKLLERDIGTLEIAEFSELRAEIEAQLAHLDSRHAIKAETFMADCRYALISGACREAIRSSREKRREISEKVDHFVCNRYVGLPLFLLVMYATFWFTFTCAEPLMGGVENTFAALGEGINTIWPAGKFDFFRSLLVEGIIAGVGGVIVFLPNILFLFLAIAFLEDSGYMARAAFVMDGVMRIFGLHGKSFIPLVLGFGCTVPAIMATRNIEYERDRKTTIMVLPLMSCGARLPIYALLIPAFFAPSHQATMMWLIYAIGIVVALCAARVMKKTLFKGEGEVYLMELPPYRMPTLRSLLLHMWDRGVMYLHKAGTIILITSIILFLANSYPKKQSFAVDYQAKLNKIAATAENLSAEAIQEAEAEIYARQQAEKMEYTISGRLGKFLEPVFRPLGFDWRITTASIGALAAKEVFVSQLGILFAVGEADEKSLPLREKLIRAYTPLQGFCMMLFSLLSIPCLATLIIIRRELNSWKYAFAEAVGLFLLAWIATFAVYQIGSLLQIGTTLIS